MTIFECLNLRTEFENIIQYRKSYNLPTLDSDIHSLVYFMETGYKKNRLRKDANRALKIAEMIIESYENENPNLSSLYGKTL